MVSRGDHSTAGRALTAVLWALIAVEIYGFLTVQPWHQTIWYPEGLQRLRYFTAVFLGIATPVAILAPWAVTPLAAIIVAGCTIHAVGWAATLGPALLLASSWSLGSLLDRRKEKCVAAHLLDTLIGLSIYVFLMTVTARLPVHYAAVWLLVLSPPLLWRGKLLLRGQPKKTSCPPAPDRSLAATLALTLLIFVLCAHWLVVLKPEAGADGLAGHLAVATNVAAHHAYTVDPARLVWAVMPLGADWTYSIAYLLGGEFAARLLNFSYLLLIPALLYTVARRWLPRAPALLMVAVFAATPMVQLVTGELFVENLQALLLLGMTVALADGSLPIAALLAGTALATKIGSLAFLLCAAPFALQLGFRNGAPARRARAFKRLALAALLLLVAALPSYVIAWRLTGDPLYPYFTQTFHSPLLPPTADVREYRFHEALRWSTLYDLTFHSARFYEGQDGSFGFQFLVLAPLAVWVAFAERRARPFGLVAAAGMLVVLLSTPNARYLFPALPLLTAASAAALARMAQYRLATYRTAVAYLLLCAAANIWFLPSSSWYHKNFYLPKPLSLRWQGFHISMVSAQRDVALHFRRAHPGGNVLLVGDNDQADLAADAHELGWHEPVLEDAVHRALDMPAMARLMQQWKIQFVIAPQSRSGRWFRPAPLRELLASCAQTEYAYETYFVARLDPGCLDRAPADHPATTVPAGSYDDFDSALRYRGDWDHRGDFDGPYLHSISFSDVPGAEAALTFQGRSLTYVFTKAPNRGIAELWIDGTLRGTIDAYSPRIEWQARFRIADLAPGPHAAAIRVSGRKSQDAKGQFVDVDALMVE